MRNPKRTLALAAISIAAMVGATTLYAEDSREPAGPMMRDGMMGGDGNMIKRMGQMMDHCAGMMKQRDGRPTAPDKGG